MRFVSATLAAAALAGVLATPAHADQEFPATLAGHAILPAASFLDAPADAPADLKVSGKFAAPGGRRVDAVGSVPGMDGVRPTGLSFPFKGQPLQGFSGIKTVGDGTFWVITDNGFGAKANSPDSMLMLNRFRIDWQKGAVERVEGIFLHDPDRKVPFRIANEGTEKRYLTGADLDIESFQIVGDKIWIGEEFGPFLVRADRTGKIEAVVETRVDGKPVRSPDHPAVTTPATPDGKVAFNLRRSKGYEGMAASKDGKFLYALLEGPLWDAEKGAYEGEKGKEYLRIVEFDVARGDWSGRHWTYPLEQNGHAIGDFNMIDATTGLIIERDNAEGSADKACPAGEKRPDCFEAPAKFKRVYKIELTDANAGGAVRKIGHIDLMKIRDPNGKARQGGREGLFDFPFFTIENVDVVDERHIVVGNDNNLPFSAGRVPNKADDNEFVLLEVADLLKAR
ncbi:esterase-like activity of phytase family protein [Chelatococcus sp. SYSU_G07232]|uniref:Esterase-like activity of phytase family protein n=1 Tax=Chelatococcus albus TaxID=3047466 RepID=A0ABT7AJ60_9HYPH|nr:esterase-like activity of phytase family protein [Chelatococcus sp. SYSU_G07232]MDJ1159411.1 esterase-like activity of phytase family protein [Chelatococcus sp. SYSU_G07232]